MVVLMHQDDIELVIEKANAKHVSEIESTFLTQQTIRCYKGERFERKKKRILDVRTHFRPIETFQSTHLNSCNLAEVERFCQRRNSQASYIKDQQTLPKLLSRRT